MKKIIVCLLVLLAIGTIRTQYDKAILRSFMASMANRSVITINNVAEFDKEIPNCQSIAIVKFYAPWCSACSSIKKLYVDLAHKYPTASFYQANISGKKGKVFIKKFSLRSLPTFCLFKDGKKITFEDEQGKSVDRIVGTKQLELLAKQIELLLAS